MGVHVHVLLTRPAERARSDTVPECSPANMTAAAPEGEWLASRMVADSTPMSPSVLSANATPTRRKLRRNGSRGKSYDHVLSAQAMPGLLSFEAGERWCAKRKAGREGLVTSKAKAIELLSVTAT